MRVRGSQFYRYRLAEGKRNQNNVHGNLEHKSEAAETESPWAAERNDYWCAIGEMVNESLIT